MEKGESTYHEISLEADMTGFSEEEDAKRIEGGVGEIPILTKQSYQPPPKVKKKTAITVFKEKLMKRS